MVSAQSDTIGTDARGLEPMTRDDSEGPMIQTSLEVKSVFGSSADECATSMAGSIHPSSDGMICSRLRAGAAAGAISSTLSDGRSKSCPS